MTGQENRGSARARPRARTKSSVHARESPPNLSAEERVLYKLCTAIANALDKDPSKATPRSMYPRRARGDASR